MTLEWEKLFLDEDEEEKEKKNALLLPLIVNVKMTELLRRTPA